MNSPFVYFTDAVLRAPTIGSMLMCVAASLVGVLVLLRKQSLLGESLSHAAYPGVILGTLAVALFIGDDAPEFSVTLYIMGGAFATSLIGLWFISVLETKFKMASDAALCFILSCFFGIGLTIASHLQASHSSLYRQGQAYLFGQVATMTDWHVAVYGGLALVTLIAVLLLYKELQVVIFDRNLAVTMGLPIRTINLVVSALIAFAVVVGLRSVGVVLMSAMLIAPAVAARQFTNKFGHMLGLAALFGMMAGFLGNYLSVELTRQAISQQSLRHFALPTGPMIVLVAAVICVIALFGAPQRGYFPRLARVAAFRYRCLAENLLKSLWRFGPNAEVPFTELLRYQSVSPLYLRLVLRRLVRGGWIERVGSDKFKLNKDGELRGAKIVRLHRLWEVYLADYVGVGGERVHRNAEEMEHIITPELEEQLTRLLNDPKRDPHRQPIPKKNLL